MPEVAALPTNESDFIGRLPLAPTTCLRLGVLASGRGTNLQTLLDSAASESFPARVVAVAANRASAPALDRGRRAGVPTEPFPQNRFATLDERDAAIQRFLERHGVDLVVLAGYDRVLSTGFLEAFPNRIVNVHPSLLPAFAGTLNAPAEAIRYGVKITGCTVHFVTDELDGGPVILQRAVSVGEDDTPESLAARILAEEHRLLPEAIRLLAAGRVRVAGRHCRIVPEGYETPSP